MKLQTKPRKPRTVKTIPRQLWTVTLIFLKYFFIACGKFASPYLGKALKPQEQRYPFLSAYVVFFCVQTMVWLPVFGDFFFFFFFLTCTQMLMHAIAHGGCTDTVRQSALEFDSGRKIALPPLGLELASWLFQSDALPTERSLPQTVFFFFFFFFSLPYTNHESPRRHNSNVEP